MLQQSVKNKETDQMQDVIPSMAGLFLSAIMSRLAQSSTRPPLQ